MDDPDVAVTVATPTLSADVPIRTKTEDRLGRGKIAARIATEAITAPADSGFVIGLCGPWGSGKSSIANLIEEELSDDERAIIVRFNPWYFTGTEDLLGCFFSELISAVGEHGNVLRTVAQKVGQYAGALAVLARLAPGVGTTASTVLDGANHLAESMAKTPSLVERRRELEQALLAFDGRIVVIIDDVDRMADGEVIEIVRLAKLVGDLPRITYILAFDRERVEEILGGGQRADKRRRGRAYMEKIVQSRFDVPPARVGTLANMMVDELNLLLKPYGRSPTPHADWINLMALGLRPLLCVPRDAKRFANAIPAAVEMLADEVALVDLLALEAIRIFEPDVHATLPRIARLLMGSDIAGSSDPNVAAANQKVVDAVVEAAQHPQVVRSRLIPRVNSFGGSSA